MKTRFDTTFELRRGLVGALLALVACGGGDNAEPDAAVGVPREVIEAPKLLAVSELGEAILHGGPGDRARITLTAPSPTLDWNLHGHAGASTQTVHEELTVMSADYMFLPEATADWFLLIRNQGSTPMNVQARIELYGDITWSGWQ